MSSEAETTPKPEKPSLTQVIRSVAAAAFGVQNRKNRERDFTHGSATSFIVAGLIFTALLIAGLYAVVQLVLAQAGQ